MRARHTLRRASARGLTEGWARYASDGPGPQIPALRDRLLAAAPLVQECVRRSAQSLTDGRFCALGRDWPRRWPGTPLAGDLWRLDPNTGRLWPGTDTFTFDIQLAPQPDLGPARHALELNRLHLLQPLAADVLLSDTAAARATLEETIESWHAANPPFRGIAWCRSLECALRAISLAIAAAFAGDRLAPETQARLRQCLAAHAFWIDRFRSPASTAPLDALAEATAELLFSVALPDLPGAAARGARARQDLPQLAGRLLREDGAPLGGSPRQGAFTAELLLLAAVVARAARHPLNSVVDQRLSRFAHLIGWLADGRGHVPAIGEDDESRVVSLCRPEPGAAVSVARAICRFLGEPDAGFPPASPHLRDALLGGPSVPAAAAARVGVASFASAGLSVLREQRAGRALTLALCGHGGAPHGGHADTLALLATVDGRPLLVDAGAYTNPIAPDWEDWFQGVTAHNTLAILAGAGGTGASAPTLRHGADARIDRLTDGAEWCIEASHGGYMRPFGVRHARTLSATPDGFVVHDRLIGSDTPLKVEIVFQLGPDCTAVHDDRTVSVAAAPGLAPVRFTFATPGDLSLSRGGGLGTGWVATGYGTKAPAWRLAWRGRIGSSGSQVRISLCS